LAEAEGVRLGDDRGGRFADRLLPGVSRLEPILFGGWL
jgi:hypothetical protein